MTDLVTCPHCSHRFEISAALRDDLEKDVRAQLEGRLAEAIARHQAEHEAAIAKKHEELAAIAKKRDALQKTAQDLEEKLRSEALEREQRIATEAARIRAQAEKDAEARAARTIAEATKAKDSELEKVKAKLGAAQKVEADVLRMKRELEDRELAMAVEIERKLEAERSAFREKHEKDSQERITRARVEALRTKDEELAEAKRQLDHAALKELELVKQKGLLEEAQRRAAAEAQIQIQDETRKAREELLGRAAEQKALLEAEHNKQREQMQTQICELQRKLSQGSQQVQGEAQEVVLRELIVQAFPMDAISDVGTGIEGADLLHNVRDELGLEAGTIVWESKRTKSWSDAWLSKLRDDVRAAGAACAILVTQVLPAGVTGFGERDGIWICSPAYAVGLARVLRCGLVELAQARRAESGRSEKIHLLYSYLTGPEFKAKVGGALEAFRELQQELLREQRVMRTSWKRRERQIQRALVNLTGFYGDVRGIAGRVIPTIEELELEFDQPLLALGEGDDDETRAPSSPRAEDRELVAMLFGLVPMEGSIGNKTLSERFRQEAHERLGLEIDESDYERCRAILIDNGQIRKGRGRGGSVARSLAAEAAE